MKDSFALRDLTFRFRFRVEEVRVYGLRVTEHDKPSTG